MQPKHPRTILLPKIVDIFAALWAISHSINGHRNAVEYFHGPSQFYEHHQDKMEDLLRLRNEVINRLRIEARLLSTGRAYEEESDRWIEVFEGEGYRFHNESYQPSNAPNGSPIAQNESKPDRVAKPKLRDALSTWHGPRRAVAAVPTCCWASWPKHARSREPSSKGSAAANTGRPEQAATWAAPWFQYMSGVCGACRR